MRGMSQTELSKATGIPRPTISNYVNGKYEAKNDGVYLIAKALGVSEAWLMGFDVVSARQDVQLKSDKIVDLVARLRRDDHFLELTYRLSSLNESELLVVSRMVEGLFQKSEDDQK